MEIKNPRRILVLGAPDSGALSLLKDLTGSAPTLVSDTTAGLSHTWLVKTRYYTATLPIWLDEIPSLPHWHSEFTKREAREVISVLGAWIFVFRKPVHADDVEDIKEALKAIQDAIQKAEGYGGYGGDGGHGGDAICLAVAMPQSMTPKVAVEMGQEEWEECCMEYGFEYVDSEARGKNEFGEAVGIKRVEDALMAHEWDGEDGGLGFEGDDEFGEFDVGFDAEEVEMGRELFGLKAAVHGVGDGDGDEDEGTQVEELERMMRRVVAIKETGEGMSEAERKRFAAKAVNDLMKDF